MLPVDRRCSSENELAGPHPFPRSPRAPYHVTSHFAQKTLQSLCAHTFLPPQAHLLSDLGEVHFLGWTCVCSRAEGPRCCVFTHSPFLRLGAPGSCP